MCFYLKVLKKKNEEVFIELSEIRKEKLKSMIAYENENLFIINKNLGDVIHKGSGHNISLLEEFRAYYSNNKVNFVNRIDKLTSGLVIGAKNIKTAREIAKEIQLGNITKKYYILVYGKIEKEEFILEDISEIGAIVNYITEEKKKFQPMGANFGIIRSLDENIRDKKEKYRRLSQRAIEYLKKSIKGDIIRMIENL